MLICIQIVILLYKGLKLTQKLTQKLIQNFYDFNKYIKNKKVAELLVFTSDLTTYT